MNLTSDHPYWFIKNGLIRSYPFPTDDLRCDVAVVGAGITGAMVAERLSRDGHCVVVLDERDVCRGSTSASTAFLQYEIDVPLTQLASMIGSDDAAKGWQLSHQAIDDLQKLILETGSDCCFRRTLSIQIAYTRKAAKALADEHRARQAIGLDCRYHNSRELLSRFGLKGVAAVSNNQSASCDGYRLAHDLLARSTEHGAQIFDRTRVISFDCSKGEFVTLSTSRDIKVCARHVVVATGYEAQTMLKERVVNLDNTYAVVSQPLKSVAPWDLNWMIWEAQTPYLYLRCTDDHRILVGGEDDRYHSPKRRDASIVGKSEILHAKTRKLIPALEWEVEFAWGGTFGKTKDGLAFIGESDEYPGCMFTLGFGGNGITFSSIATNIIADRIGGRTNSDARLFRFGR